MAERRVCWVPSMVRIPSAAAAQVCLLQVITDDRFSTGLNSAGAAFGALFNAWSADRFSRKYTIQVGALILVIGAGIGAGSVDVAMLMVSRFVSGWGIGIMISVIPM